MQNDRLSKQLNLLFCIPNNIRLIRISKRNTYIEERDKNKQFKTKLIQSSIFFSIGIKMCKKLIKKQLKIKTIISINQKVKRKIKV